MIIRELPGLVEVEDKARLYGYDDGRTEYAAERFSERHFNINSMALYKMHLDDDVSINPDQLEDELQNHPKHLLTPLLSDDEIVYFLLNFGFDLRCSLGKPLLCTKAIATQVEAVARGLAGRVPDIADVETEKFEAKLRAEATAFSARKHRR